MSTEITKNKNNSRKIGIKWKMFAILLVFIVAVISVIWFFQVFMLDVFYRIAKFNELKYTAEKIELTSYDVGAMEETVYDCAKEYDSSIKDCPNE